MDHSIAPDIKKQLIKRQTCFSQLSEDEAERLAALFIELSMLKGETIVNEGDPVDSIYLIVEGRAEVQHININHNQVHTTAIAILDAGDAIGLNEDGFYSLNGIRTATVIVLSEKITLLKLKVAAFHGFALVHPHVMQIMRYNAEGILGKL